MKNIENVRFYFFIDGIKEFIDEKHILWNKLLPVFRGRNVSYINRKYSKTISYGKYFKIVSYLLKKNNFRILINSVKSKLKKFEFFYGIKKICVNLIKHGALYHPAKIDVIIDSLVLHFVINVAISEIGRLYMQKEICNIIYINHNFSVGYLPKIYSYYCNTVYFGEKISLFVGHWYCDFYEYHMTTYLKKHSIYVWNSKKTKLLLSKIQTKELYRQMSLILSLYYDPVSSRQIYPLSNAAGDFIVKINKKKVDLRLISVRDFYPMFIKNMNDTNNLPCIRIIHIMAIYLMFISFIIRMDRLDGIGNLILLNEIYIFSIIEGFFQGISLKARKIGLYYGLSNFLCEYILNSKRKKFKFLLIKIFEKFFKNRKDELDIVLKNIEIHLDFFYLDIIKIKKIYLNI